MKAIGDFIFLLWNFYILQTTLLFHTMDLLYWQFNTYISYIFRYVCFYFFSLDYAATTAFINWVSTCILLFLIEQTNSLLKKLFCKLHLEKGRRRKENVGLEFVAASNKFRNNERITLKTFDAWNALFALKREKTCPVGATGPLPRKEKCLRWWDV